MGNNQRLTRRWSEPRQGRRSCNRCGSSRRVAELGSVSPMREQIRREIEAIEPMDAVEREHRADALAWIASGAELFRVAKPACPPKHLVAYFVVTESERPGASRWSHPVEPARPRAGASRPDKPAYRPCARACAAAHDYVRSNRRFDRRPYGCPSVVGGAHRAQFGPEA